MVCLIVAKWTVILKDAQQIGGSMKQQAKPGMYVELQKGILMWFWKVCAVNIHTDCTVLREKADQVALSLGTENFMALNG